MNRVELRRLAQDRLDDAKALLAAKRWSGAYYLAGYAVECGLKACVLALVERTGILFEEKDYAAKCWTHNLKVLLELAGLETDLGAAMATNRQLRSNWLTVKVWNEASRYRVTPYFEAKKLYWAVAEKKDGVLQWMKDHW